MTTDNDMTISNLHKVAVSAGQTICNITRGSGDKYFCIIEVAKTFRRGSLDNATFTPVLKQYGTLQPTDEYDYWIGAVLPASGKADAAYSGTTGDFILKTDLNDRINIHVYNADVRGGFLFIARTSTALTIPNQSWSQSGQSGNIGAVVYGVKCGSRGQNANITSLNEFTSTNGGQCSAISYDFTNNYTKTTLSGSGSVTTATGITYTRNGSTGAVTILSSTSKGRYYMDSSHNGNVEVGITINLGSATGKTVYVELSGE